MSKRPKNKKNKKGPPKRNTSGPRDPNVKELERLINKIEQDAHEQRQSDSESYTLPYAMLGHLVAVGLPRVSSDLEIFVRDLTYLTDLLPAECMAVMVIRSLMKAETPSGVMTLYRQTRWHALGKPALTLDAGLVARLMLTDYPKGEGLEELTPPWDAFLIRLPEGLIEYAGVKYTGVLVHRYVSSAPPPLPADIPENVRSTVERAHKFMTERQGVKWGIYGLTGDQGHLQGEARLGEHLGHAPRVSFDTPELPFGDAGEGVLTLFARLVVGVCSLLDDGDSLKQLPSTGSGTTEFACDYQTSIQSTSSITTVQKYLHQLSLHGFTPPPITVDLASSAAVREQYESEAFKEPVIDSSGRRRATRAITTDADPLSPFEEYLNAKYEGEDPNVIYECLILLETVGLEKAAIESRKSQQWIEKWGCLYGSEHVLRDTTMGDPFYRALLELTKLHPQDFRDLWEDEEKVQPELEAMPVGHHNMILCGVPFLRGRVETAKLKDDREQSRKIRAVRAARPLRVIK